MSRCFEAYNGKPLERTRRTGIFSAIRVCELGPEDRKVWDVFLNLVRDRLTDFFTRLEERRSDRLLDDFAVPIWAIRPLDVSGGSLFDIYNTEDNLICSLQCNESGLTRKYDSSHNLLCLR